MAADAAQLRELAVKISVAYLRANPVTADKVGNMVRDTYEALSACAAPRTEPVPLAVPPARQGKRTARA
ncbi:hypothetical protein [Indioceanicola profundi]|uniref:hypothetical protein n=1 Tax=Indioceanicola profundi TaxID=2220096 RepID=UPI000E6AA51A|nr:hypothetical protein [Indioceanicola profundi]